MSIRPTQFLLSVLLLFAAFPPATYSQPIIWEQASNGMGDTAVVTAIAGNAQGRLFAGVRISGNSSAFFQSNDNGAKWMPTYSNSLFTCNFIYLAIDSSGWIYAGVAAGLYLSTDNGLTWTKTGIHGSYGPVSHVYINHNGFIFASVNDYDEGMYRSTDRGRTWEISLSTPRPVTCVASNSRGTLFVGIRKEMGYGGLAISTDNGYTWRPRLFSDREVQSIVVDHADRVFVTVNGVNPQTLLFRSSDDGHTWDTLSVPIFMFPLGINSADHIFGAMPRYAGTNPHLSDSIGIVRSTDNGITWVDDNQGLPVQTGGITALYISPDDYVFLGTYGHGIYRSSQPTTSVQTSRPGADSYLLGRNYPNPVTGSTTIPYTLPREEKVSLTVLNTLGQVVTTLVDEHCGPGAYEARWQAAVPAGLYFYRLRAGTIVETRKMIVR